MLNLIAEAPMFTAILLGAAGIALVSWKEVFVPVARLLELSGDLAGARAELRLEHPATRTSGRWFFAHRSMRAHELCPLKNH